jgi:protein regulator of cytokinesis 1
MLQEYNKLIDNKMQEMKKMSIPQPVAEGDNFYMARPASSNRRISNRSMNGGFGSGSPVFRLNRDDTSSVVSLFSGPLSP